MEGHSAGTAMPSAQATSAAWLVRSAPKRSTSGAAARLAAMAPRYTTPMYAPSRVGDTPMACAKAGPIAGTASTAIDTSAWIASVTSSTLQLPAVGGVAAGSEGCTAATSLPAFRLHANIAGPMSDAPPRIALIHATALAVQPIHDAFERHWPQAMRMNLLDDSLSVDLAAAGALTPAMVQRFIALARYAKGTGCAAILFTCSAFGPAIEAAGRDVGRPTLKPNEAMFEQALAMARPGAVLRVGLLATFQPSIASMAAELRSMAASRGIEVDLRSVFVPDAMGDLAQGRAGDHHRKIAEAALTLQDSDVVLLAQFSMAAARDIAQAQLKCPVLSSPDCAVQALQQKVSSHA